jgi:2'-5' RNA ligase
MKSLSGRDQALVVLLPLRIRTEIDLWRKAHDPNYGSVPPHITVAYPPFVPEEQWPSVQPTVRDCLSQFHPFQIRLQGLGTFETDHYVLWLQVHDDGQLSLIRAALMGCLPQYVSPLPFDYVPHVTAGIFGSQSEMDSVREAMRVGMRPRRFTVHQLTYLARDQRGAWCACSPVILGVRDRL